MSAKDNNKDYPYNISTIGDYFLILQHKSEPTITHIACNPNHELFPVFIAIMEILASTDLWDKMLDLWEGPNRPFIRRKNRDGEDSKWPLIAWDEKTDRLIKTLAEAIVELRFSNPERTRIVVQDVLWPELEDA